MADEQCCVCHQCGHRFTLPLSVETLVCPRCSSEFVERLETGHFQPQEGNGDDEGPGYYIDDDTNGDDEGSRIRFHQIPGGFVFGFGHPNLGMFQTSVSQNASTRADASDLFRLVLHPDSIPANHPLWLRLGFHGDPRDYILGDAAFQQALDALMHQAGHHTVGLRPEQIEDLPREIVSTEDRVTSSSDDAKDCAICQESFKVGEELIQLCCNHRFHADCVAPWLLKVSSCPVCRHDPLQSFPSKDSASPPA